MKDVAASAPVPLHSALRLGNGGFVPGTVPLLEPREPGQRIGSIRGRPVSSRETAEARLVFHLAGADASAFISNLPLQRFDWNLLLRTATLENALVAVRDYFRSVQPGVMPLPVERQLTILSLDRELRMRRLERRLVESVTALNARGVTPVLLKGAALASTVYGSFSRRPMNDIDILVKPEEEQRAETVLLSAGWMRDAAVPDEFYYREHHHLAPLLDEKGTGLHFEVHRDLFPPGHPFQYTHDELLRSARPITVGGARALVLSPAYHVVHAAIHFVWSHMMRTGGWNTLRDLGTLQRAGCIDWSEVIDIAERWRATSCCYWALRLGRSLAHSFVPEWVLERLRPQISPVVLRVLERHFIQFLTRRELSCPSVYLERALWTKAIEPTRLGHGTSRPWLVSPDLQQAYGPPGSSSMLQRLVGHLSKVRRWSSYAVALLA
jgi:hypothetical protein